MKMHATLGLRRAARQSIPGCRSRFRPRLEMLEDRIVPVAGALDGGFGTLGKVVTDFGSSDFADDIALQDDGRIVVVGSTNANFALARYNSDGALDTTFGGDGRVSTDFGGADAARGVALWDGKIVVAGNSIQDGESHVALARYHAGGLLSGLLDTSFGDNGQVVTSFSGFANAMTITDDGHILVAGRTTDDESEFLLVRFDSEGNLDLDFNVVTTSIAFGEPDEANDIALQDDGKIVLAGKAGNDFGLVRYLPSGIPDYFGFGEDAKVVTPYLNGPAEVRAITIQPDGRIVAAGSAELVGTSFTKVGLVRYLPDGNLDPEFSGNGFIDFLFEIGEFDFANAVALDVAGRILVAGTTVSHDASPQIFLARFRPDGSLDDTGFGNNGIVVTKMPGFESTSGSAMAIQNDGKIVVAGLAKNSQGYDFALARYHGAKLTFSQQGGTLFGEGDNGDDDVTVIDGPGGITVVEDGHAVATFTGIKQIDFHLKNGDDSYTHQADAESTPANLTIDLGPGDDKVQFLRADLIPPPPPPEDEPPVRDDPPPRGRPVPGSGGPWSILLKTGDGADEIDIDVRAWAQHDVVFGADLGDGDDHFAALGASLVGPTWKFKIAGGAGEDDMAVVIGGLKAGAVDLQGGDGDDGILAQIGFILQPDLSEAPSRPKAIMIGGGNGDDAIDVAIERMKGGLFDVQGGSGDDNIMAHVAFNPQPDPPGEPFTPAVLKVNGDRGHDDIALTITGIKGGSVDVIGGAGDDNIQAQISFNPQPDPPGEPFAPAVVTVAGELGADQMEIHLTATAADELAEYDYSPDLTTNAVLNVFGGGGDDAVTIDYAGDLAGALAINATGGQGNDQFELAFEACVLPESKLFVHVMGQAGNDSIELGMNVDTVDDPNIRVTLDGGAGDDLLALVARGFSMDGNSIKLLGGAGRDRLMANLTVPYVGHGASRMGGPGTLLLDGGAGNDHIRARLAHNPPEEFPAPPSAPLFVRLQGGAGNDQLFLDTVGFNDRLLKAFINGGAGFDRARVTGNVRAKMRGIEA